MAHDPSEEPGLALRRVALDSLHLDPANARCSLSRPLGVPCAEVRPRQSGNRAGSSLESQQRTDLGDVRLCELGAGRNVAAVGRKRRPRTQGLSRLSCNSCPSQPSTSHLQLPHVTVRFISSRATRAVRCLALSTSGTFAPVPKYTSSGVWPRNAECGRRALCSLT